MIKVTRQGSATIIAFTDHRGYLSQGVVEELSVALDRIAVDDDSRVVIFTGALPGVFIRHYDVAELAEAARRLHRSSRSDAEISDITRGANPVSTCFQGIERLPQPTIAAINGCCQGGGYELALCCDFRIAEAGNYRIGLPEVHLGIVPGGGGTQRLTRMVGEARALDLILRGRALAPDDALAAGMVHEVVSDAMARSLAIGAELDAIPRATLAAAKRLIRRARDAPIETGLADERAAFSLLLRNEPEAGKRSAAFASFEGDINAFVSHQGSVRKNGPNDRPSKTATE